MNNNVAIINDISGVGKCSLTVSIPVFSYFEIECNPVITAILSNQTAYENFYFFDFTPYMKAYLDVWEKENRKFKGIYSGFLGSIGAIDVVLEFIQNHKEAFIVVDPVMGDNDKVYTTYTEEMCSKMKELIKEAHLVTPNLTEAKILTDRRLEEVVDEKLAKVLAKEISDLGPKFVVITGIVEEDKIKNIAYSKDEDKFYIKEENYYPYSFSGTGDLFASLITAFILKGKNIEVALELATKILGVSIVNSIEMGVKDTKEGIKFEKALKGVNIDE